MCVLFNVSKMGERGKEARAHELRAGMARKQCLQMMEHKSAMDWFDEMKRTYPDIEVFSFDVDDKVSRAPSTADKGSEGLRQVVEVVTPYDVIDRLGRHESATQAEHDRPSPSQRGSKGSAERRKRRRQLAAAAASAAMDAATASAAATAAWAVAAAAPAAEAAPSTARAQATRAPASVRPRA